MNINAANGIVNTIGGTIGKGKVCGQRWITKLIFLHGYIRFFS